MSRIRSVHPKLWTDEAFMSLSPLARLLYIGIWTEAFDDGVFEWKPRTLKARIFPGDGEIDVVGLLAELAAANCIAEREDPKPYGIIRNFRLYQRPKKPNSSGLLQVSDHQYVGLVPDQYGTNTELGPQMEDGGGRVEEEDRTSPPVIVAEGARDLFFELEEAFPQNPSSSETKAKAAFERINPSEREAVVAAAQRYSRWFGQDCEARGRTIDAGLRFVPHLANWLDSGEWRGAAKLPVLGEADPELTVVRPGTPEFTALEKFRGGAPIKIYGDAQGLTVRKSELEQAQAAA